MLCCSKVKKPKLIFEDEETSFSSCDSKTALRSLSSSRISSSQALAGHVPGGPAGPGGPGGPA